MSTNAERAFAEFGQSIWFDNIRRGALLDGQFAAIIASGVRGCTSNPSIFYQAIAGSSDYDAALKHLVSEGRDVEDIYYQLVIEDIRRAADQLFHVYEESNCLDGHVSVEVLPRNSRDVQNTVAEAQWLARRVGRRNLMIKVPATPEGIEAFRRLTALGVSVNVTLIFGLETYRRVGEAYLAGLEEAAAAGRDLSRIASVASCFVSRVDTQVDAQLARTGGTSLLGKCAIANTKAIYEAFKALVDSKRFAELKNKGAQAQRPLWASTGTKNPQYSDTLYVDGLVGPGTVNTVPPSTLAAFQEHGKVSDALSDSSHAASTLQELAAAGIDLEEVCDQLLEAGLKAFETAMDELFDAIGARRQALLEHSRERQSYALGKGSEAVVGAMKQATESRLAERIWNIEPAVFTDDETAVASIKNRLGWLTAPKGMEKHLGALQRLAEEVHHAGFRKALLLGMGGSSLCPEVLAKTFGVTPGFLELRILDNTAPSAVEAAQEWAALDETLFIVASKSGGTIEVRSFAAHFWQLAEKRFGADTGSRFIAITDPGSPLSQFAQDRKYRAIFENPADIGGRYSALSLFGLVPAALMGVDTEALLNDAKRMASSCGGAVPAAENPGVRLGAFIGGLARTGRDKMTLIATPSVRSLGSWVEQLVAESTGKKGVGVVPIDLEPLSVPENYDDERAFVFIRYSEPGEESLLAALDEQVRALVAAGHPVATLGLQSLSDLGGEFFRWEMATAVAGALLGVNPFDEPNVTEAKTATNGLIQGFEQSGKLAEDSGVSPSDSRILDTVRSAAGGDYVAISAFLEQTAATDLAFEQIRQSIFSGCGRSTTLGYGPRFLHSTGQLHKGGANNGVFVLVTEQATSDVAIPGEKYSFKILRDAQAQGDLAVLREPHQRRVVHVALGQDVEAGLKALTETFAKL